MKRTILASALGSVALAAFPAAAQTTTSQGNVLGAAPNTSNLVPGPHGYVRCATPATNPWDTRFNPPSDCSSNRTTPDPMYSPANRDVIQIQVVFHVIRNNNGGGDVPDARINSQVDILNEDFRALVGTPGAPGVDSKIEFVLATVDPSGNPTTGIDRVNNSNWANDNGNYWNTLAWNPDVYMNVYTMAAPGGSNGILGYVPFLPASNPNGPGSNADRVVVLNSAVGRNAPIGTYNQGRTLTHEVGHYLGLNHTFNGGCGGSNCYTTGDLICDTNAESAPEFNCPGNSSSCGSPDPVRNYMNYSPDTCMNNFTEEQARRMRCTLEFYRPLLGSPVGPVLGTNYCVTTPNSTGLPAVMLASGSKLIADDDFAVVASGLPQNSFGYVICSQTQAQVPNPNMSQGTICVGGNVGRFIDQIGNSGVFGSIATIVDLSSIPQPTGAVSVMPGDTWNFQCWYRDANPGLTSNFTDGYTITFE